MNGSVSQGSLFTYLVIVFCYSKIAIYWTGAEHLELLLTHGRFREEPIRTHIDVRSLSLPSNLRQCT